jgi:hypothetical protein
LIFNSRLRVGKFDDASTRVNLLIRHYSSGKFRLAPVFNGWFPHRNHLWSYGSRRTWTARHRHYQCNCYPPILRLEVDQKTPTFFAGVFFVILASLSYDSRKVILKMSNIITTPHAGGQRLRALFEAAKEFSRVFSNTPHNDLKGITDGKAVGTYVEHKFQEFLINAGVVQPEEIGSSAKGIDLPSLNTDIKVTSIKQPQSSSPFRSFKQKIEGLGYNLILFVYKKTDADTECFITLLATRFIPKERTADWQTTKGILGIIEREGNSDDIFAFLVERMIPVDEATLIQYAEHILAHPPLLGYLTISNALQWRLQYKRVITNDLEGVVNLDPPGTPSLAGVAANLIIDIEE